MPRAQVPKLIHPLPPNEVRVPKGNGSDAEDIEEEPPTPHPLTDTWMQVRACYAVKARKGHSPSTAGCNACVIALMCIFAMHDRSEH